MKARQLEEEMRRVKEAKMQVVIKQFETQLRKEARQEESKIAE